MAEPARTRGIRRPWLGAALGVVVGLSGCDGNGGVGPGNLRFGWIGEVTVQVVTPRGPFGEGELVEVLTWQSNGVWTLRQQISYRGLVGDGSLETRAAFGDAYARFITRINDDDALTLFNLDSLPSGTIEQDCGDEFSRIMVTVRDDPRDSVQTWGQCADGWLATLVTEGAHPRPEAARLVEAAVSARNETVGAGYVSAYHGSVPFGTLARGEDTPAAPSAPFPIRSQDDWAAFWVDHTGSANADPPDVDFGTEQVIVAAVGERGEAGDSVEVRRILQVADGTLTHIFERVPGDFCSPIARTQYPYHVVVAPLTPEPVRFADIPTESVSCGG